MLITFTDAILKHKVVANKLARILILFMVQNVKEIFTIPKDIRDRVNSRIDDLKTGEVSPVRGMYWPFFIFVLNLNDFFYAFLIFIGVFFSKHIFIACLTWSTALLENILNVKTIHHYSV